MEATTIKSLNVVGKKMNAKEIEEHVRVSLALANTGDMQKFKTMFHPLFNPEDRDFAKFGFTTPDEAIHALSVACPDVVFSTKKLDVNVDEQTATMTNSITGTHTSAAYCGIEPRGTHFDVEYHQIFYFKDGLIFKRVSGTQLSDIYEILKNGEKREHAGSVDDDAKAKSAATAKFSVSAPPPTTAAPTSAPAVAAKAIPRLSIGALATSKPGMISIKTGTLGSVTTVIDPSLSPRATSMKHNVKQVFDKDTLVIKALECFKKFGITHIFGVSGGNIGSFFVAAEAMDGFKIVCSKHECSAAFEAVSYAIASGTPAIVAATSGPGVTNMINGMTLANKASAPVIFICGTTMSGMNGFGTVQEYEAGELAQPESTKPIVKKSLFVSDPERFPLILSSAMCELLNERKGPVALHVPNDFWESKVTPKFPRFPEPDLVSPRMSMPAESSIASAVEMIIDAKRPVMIVGHGVRVSGAEAYVKRLAEQIPCAVVTTQFAKNVFPEDHRLSSGQLIFGGPRNAIKVINEADVLIVVGSSLTESSIPTKENLGDKHKIIRIDISIAAATRFHTSAINLIGDVKPIVKGIADKIMTYSTASICSVWQTENPPPPSAHSDLEIELSKSDSIPIEPARVKVELSKVLPDDAIMCCDVGSTFLNLYLVKGRSGQKFYSETSWSSMGQMTAGAVGLALAHPGRPVIADCGDGSFMMNGFEVVTAVEHNLPIVWIIENNGMQSLVHHGTALRNKVESFIGHTSPVNYWLIGMGMGAMSCLVTDPNDIGDAIKKAIAARVPAVIEIRTNPTCPAVFGSRVQQLVK